MICITEEPVGFAVSVVSNLSCKSVVINLSIKYTSPYYTCTEDPVGLTVAVLYEVACEIDKAYESCTMYQTLTTL